MSKRWRWQGIISNALVDTVSGARGSFFCAWFSNRNRTVHNITNGLDYKSRSIVLNVMTGIRSQDVFATRNSRQQCIVELQLQVLLQRVARKFGVLPGASEQDDGHVR